MKQLTPEWVQRVAADYRVARLAARRSPPLPNAVCFPCRQAAEKFLKALSEEGGLTVPKTHDLDHLLMLLAGRHPTLRRQRRGLVFLTGFAVDTRSPGAHASKRQAAAAVRWATRVRTAARGLLGLPAKGPRGRRGP